MEKIGKVFHEYAQGYLRQNIEGADCLFIIRYSGIKAQEMNILRQSLSNCGAELFVTRNTIGRRVFENLGLTEFSKMLQGPCGIVFGKGEPIGVSKAIHNFTKDNQNLKIEGGLLKEKILTKQEVITLANLGSREALYAKFTGVLKSPMTAMVWALSGMIRKLAYALDIIRQKKETADDTKKE